MKRPRLLDRQPGHGGNGRLPKLTRLIARVLFLIRQGSVRDATQRRPPKATTAHQEGKSRGRTLNVPAGKFQPFGLKAQCGLSMSAITCQPSAMPRHFRSIRSN